MEKYTLYLDESEYINKKNNKKILTLGGFAINNSLIHQLDGDIKKLKKKIWYKDSKPEDKIFHLTDIFTAQETNTPKQYDLILKKPEYIVFQRPSVVKETIRNIENIIINTDITVFSASANLHSLKSEFNEYYGQSYSVLFEMIIENFVHFLRHNKAEGTVILEDSSVDGYVEKKYFRILAHGSMHFNRKVIQKHLIALNMITKSENNNMLQLTDFIVRPLVLNAAQGKAMRPNIYKSIKAKRYDGYIQKANLFGTPVLEF